MFDLLKCFREKDIHIPVLYLMGEEDHLFLPPVQDLVPWQKNCRLTIIKGSGHVCNVDQPELFNRLSIDFIKTQGKIGGCGKSTMDGEVRFYCEHDELIEELEAWKDKAGGTSKTPPGTPSSGSFEGTIHTPNFWNNHTRNEIQVLHSLTT